MEAARGWAWARGCLPVAQTRAEVGQGAGLAVDFKIAPPSAKDPPTLPGAGWIPAPLCTLCCWRSAACLAGHAPVPQPLRGWEEGRGVLAAPAARRPWLCTSPAQEQAAGSHPWALSSQGTLLCRHPPGRLLGFSPGGTVPWSRWIGASPSPSITPSSWGSQEPFTPGWWSLLWDQTRGTAVPLLPASCRAPA